MPCRRRRRAARTGWGCPPRAAPSGGWLSWRRSAQL